MVLFENDQVLVIDKRPGYLSVLSRLRERDPRSCEFTYWQEKLGKKLWSVHRLDEEVSGLLILAKDAKTHAELSQGFEAHVILKTYEAWTERGERLPETGKCFRWESLLLRGKKRAYEKPFGKKAVTEATFQSESVYKGMPYLLWELNPLTGRPHQLRYECMKHGYPILGDSLYGSKLGFWREGSIALRAVSLDFCKFSARETLGLPARLEATRIQPWLEDR